MFFLKDDYVQSKYYWHGCSCHRHTCINLLSYRLTQIKQSFTKNVILSHHFIYFYCTSDRINISLNIFSQCKLKLIKYFRVLFYIKHHSYMHCKFRNNSVTGMNVQRLLYAEHISFYY